MPWIYVVAWVLPAKVVGLSGCVGFTRKSRGVKWLYGLLLAKGVVLLGYTWSHIKPRLLWVNPT